MNSSSHPEDVPGGGSPGIENVSRSGRVRKKNTLLAEYESTSAVEKPKKKPEKPQKDHNTPTPAKVTLKFGSESEAPKKKVLKKTNMKTSKKMKFSKGRDNTPSSKPPHHGGGFEPLLLAAQEEGDLEMDLPPEFETDMPILAAEEIIDESLLDAEDSMTEITEHTAINRLKSQAQSTYMMEKTMEKNRKTTTLPGNGGKAKAARKDKGNPRVTAYMLWAKDQRAIFAKKYPHLDFSSLSKKLSDLWATVPQNQKKMWKNKAGKIMRKNTNVMENIKNSGPLTQVTGKGKKPRGRPRIHPVGDEDELPLPVVGKSSIAPVRKSPQIGKAAARKPGNFLPTSEKHNKNKSNANPSPKSTWQNQTTTKPLKSKASKVANNSSGLHLGSAKIKSGKPKNVSVETKPKPSKPSIKTSLTTAIPSTSFSHTNNKQLSPRKDDDSSFYKVTGTSPIDVAAHFALLGESLSVIGERLKDVEGQTVSGSLSVLLDSLLCATGPLLCLSQQVPELNCIPQERLTHLLDNIAYVMPGL